MSDVKFKESWTQGLSEQEKKELRADIIAAQLFRKRLVKLLEDKDRDADKEFMSKTTLDKPNWETRVAEHFGYRRAINEIISLIPK